MEYNTEIHDWWLILVNSFILFRGDRQNKQLAKNAKLTNPGSNGKRDNVTKEI